jgi:hypothetical protein
MSEPEPSAAAERAGAKQRRVARGDEARMEEPSFFFGPELGTCWPPKPVVALTRRGQAAGAAKPAAQGGGRVFSPERRARAASEARSLASIK